MFLNIRDKPTDTCIIFSISRYLWSFSGKNVQVNYVYLSTIYGLPWWLRRSSVCLQCGRPGFDPWVGKIPWRRKWQPTPVPLPRKSHGWRSLVQATVHGVTKSQHDWATSFSLSTIYYWELFRTFFFLYVLDSLFCPLSWGRYLLKFSSKNQMILCISFAYNFPSVT